MILTALKQAQKMMRTDARSILEYIFPQREDMEHCDTLTSRLLGPAVESFSAWVGTPEHRTADRTFGP